MKYSRNGFWSDQVGRVSGMQKWIDNLKAVYGEQINLTMVTANNHYAGFGPCISRYVEFTEGHLARK